MALVVRDRMVQVAAHGWSSAASETAGPLPYGYQVTQPRGRSVAGDPEPVRAGPARQWFWPQYAQPGRDDVGSERTS